MSRTSWGARLLDPTWGWASIRQAMTEQCPTLKALMLDHGDAFIEGLAEYLGVWWEWWASEKPAPRIRKELAIHIIRLHGGLRLSELKFALMRMLEQEEYRPSPASVLRHLRQYRKDRQAFIASLPYAQQRALLAALPEAPRLNDGKKNVKK